MLDINVIRDQQELVKQAIVNKQSKLDLDELLQVDDERRKLITEVEALKASQNEKGAGISSGQVSGDEKETLLQELKTLKVSIKQKQGSLNQILEKWQSLMYQVPNIPHPSAPIGKDEDENVPIKTWGTKPTFDFTGKDHIELMAAKDMIDLERGAKAHGFRGYYLKNDGVRLSWALWNYAMDFFSKRGFELFIAPAIVRPQFFYGTGHLPNDAEDIFKTQDDDYLSGTAEVPMMAYHADEVIDLSEGPKKYLCFSPCYRREAGSYSKDTKGLIRVHEFYKWEQLVLAEQDEEKSLEILEELRTNLEEFIESLEIPYETVDACTGDMGQGKVKMYDTNLWVPSQDKYREISSASYLGTFQSRRLNTRYKTSDGKLAFVDSLNSTAIPTPRSLVSLVENNQKADGSIAIPKALQPYFGKEIIS